MLWGDRVGEQHARLGVRDRRRAPGRLRRRFPDPPRASSTASWIASRITVSTAAATSRPSGPCSACAQRSSAIHSAFGGVARDHHQLRGAGDPVDPHLADELALGLLDVAVAGPGDHVDRLDPLRAQRQRRDRLGAADRVDLVGAADRRRGEDHVGDGLGPGPGGVARATRLTPAALRRDAAHQDRRGIGRCAAGRVDRGRTRPRPRGARRLALSQLQPGVLGELGLGDRADVARGGLERGEQIGPSRDAAAPSASSGTAEGIGCAPSLPPKRASISATASSPPLPDLAR